MKLISWITCTSVGREIILVSVSNTCIIDIHVQVFAWDPYVCVCGLL